MNRRDMVSNMKRSQAKPIDHVDKFERNFWRAFVVMIVLNIIVIGVGAWAVVELVQWITSK